MSETPKTPGTGTAAGAGALLPREQRRWSLRLRVIAVILLVAFLPQLLVFAWSQLDRNVPGRMWTSARDAMDEAARQVETSFALSKSAALPEEELRRIARERRVRLRVIDGESGAIQFEEDSNASDGPLERLESFFLGAIDAPSLRELDAELGPILARPPVESARRNGPYVACDYLPLVFCQAVRVTDHRIVYVQMSSQRAVYAVYSLRYQLLRIALITAPLSLIVAIYMGGRVVRPIERLRRQAWARAHAASPGAKLDPERRDEVGVLADAFNAVLVALEDKRKQNEAFVADLVHELKNPVAAVRTAAETLTLGSLDRDRAGRVSRVLRDSTTKLDALVTSFLELARAEAGMPNEERSDVDVAALLHGLVEGARADGRHAAITFTVTAPGAPLIVHGVSHRLDALFRELLENGASFAGDGGEVSIALDRAASEVVVRVGDSGSGIAPADLPRVFQRFFTTRGPKRGTGLGLALVQAVAEAHGGSVSAASPPGKGATFEVRLPLLP